MTLAASVDAACQNPVRVSHCTEPALSMSIAPGADTAMWVCSPTRLQSRLQSKENVSVLR